MITLKRLRYADAEPMVFVETYLSYQKYGLCFRENLRGEFSLCRLG